jgi:hypothetical protein
MVDCTPVCQDRLARSSPGPPARHETCVSPLDFTPDIASLISTPPLLLLNPPHSSSGPWINVHLYIRCLVPPFTSPIPIGPSRTTADLHTLAQRAHRLSSRPKQYRQRTSDPIGDNIQRLISLPPWSILVLSATKGHRSGIIPCLQTTERPVLCDPDSSWFESQV